MIDLRELPDGIIEMHIDGIAGAAEWREYKDKIMQHLEASQTLQYILTDLSHIEGVDNSILKEFGHAPHLAHEKLGFLVLLGGNAFQQFIGKITESNALRSSPSSKLRVHYEREAALEFLRERRKIDQAEG